MPLRITITQQWNAPHTLEWTERAWRTEWESYSMDKIRFLVIRQAAINTLVLECEGGNEFHG
jgi:hypothetical protein